MRTSAAMANKIAMRPCTVEISRKTIFIEVPLEYADAQSEPRGKANGPPRQLTASYKGRVDRPAECALRVLLPGALSGIEVRHRRYRNNPPCCRRRCAREVAFR